MACFRSDRAFHGHLERRHWLFRPVSHSTPNYLFIKLTLQTSWVASTLLPSDEQAYVQTGHGLYDPSQSTSAQPLDGENFEIGYGDGSGSSGPEYTETVVLGDVALAGMPIGVANMQPVATPTDLSVWASSPSTPSNPTSSLLSPKPFNPPVPFQSLSSQPTSPQTTAVSSSSANTTPPSTPAPSPKSPSTTAPASGSSTTSPST